MNFVSPSTFTFLMRGLGSVSRGRFLVKASMPSWIDFVGTARGIEDGGGGGMFGFGVRDFIGERGERGTWEVIALMVVLFW
jgi:hypothetical protein